MSCGVLRSTSLSLRFERLLLSTSHFSVSLMAEAQTQLQDSLLQGKEAQELEGEEAHDPLLDHALHRFEVFLLLLGFRQSSVLSIFLSWAAFLLLGVLIPALTMALSHCSIHGEQQITNFELYILTSQALLASVSLICLSYSIRKYGMRKFLFVDRFHGQMIRFHKEYVEKIEILKQGQSLHWNPLFALLVFSFSGIILFITFEEGFFRVLSWCLLPCFLLKIAREFIRLAYVHHKTWWQSVGIFLALVVSWTYLSMIFLSACSLFNLICNLQAIHFEDYGKLLERDTDTLTSLEEHIRLRYNLSKISHRFRIFLLLASLVVTASLFVSLFVTTGYQGVITFISGGDFAVSSIVQVVGIILCLHAAAKITHRAQGIAGVASRWHALATCNSTDAPQLRTSNSAVNLEANPVHVLHVNYSESDLESAYNLGLPANTQLGPYMSSYHKRQALVMYVQSNPGGLTVFGWTVDRALINTIFFIELSLVLFVLGKTIVFTSK